MLEDSDNFKISDYNHIASTLGNAFFSGISFSLLWEAVSTSKTREELDTKISRAIACKDEIDDYIKKKMNKS